MLSVIEFKKRYPRQFKYLINLYGGRTNIFDVSAAIQMYLRNEPPPQCEVCNKSLTVTKKFREPGAALRCSKHINTNNIISRDDLISATNAITFLPEKALTKSDQIEITCNEHGPYRVNLGNFLIGMRCQKCYHDSRKGKPGIVHSDATKRKMSKSKLGKKIKLSEETKKEKTQKQKTSWEKRKSDKDNYEKYISVLSAARKKYIKDHGYCFPNKEKTGLELKFENYLISKNIKFVSQYILEGKKFDFYLVEMKLIVEIDGEYWHRQKSSIKNDIEKHKICEKNQIDIVRISSDNYLPDIIFESLEKRHDHNKQILLKRGINGYK
jgi:very-short-patch-repair endonuclease